MTCPSSALPTSAANMLYREGQSQGETAAGWSSPRRSGIVLGRNRVFPVFPELRAEGHTAGSQVESMTRLLLIVSRAEAGRYAYFKHVFANRHLFADEVVDVMVDRRTAQRRARPALMALENRRRERRVRSLVAKDLQTFGWAVVRK